MVNVQSLLLSSKLDGPPQNFASFPIRALQPHARVAAIVLRSTQRLSLDTFAQHGWRLAGIDQSSGHSLVSQEALRPGLSGPPGLPGARTTGAKHLRRTTRLPEKMSRYCPAARISLRCPRGLRGLSGFEGRLCASRV